MMPIAMFPIDAGGEHVVLGLAYAELKRLAHAARRRARPQQTLDTTTLVHEAYLKIENYPQVAGMDGEHLRALVARSMRQILVDRARAAARQKRGGLLEHVTLGRADAAMPDTPLDVVAVDRALGALEELDARLGRIVEMHVFAGMTMTEIARVRGVTERTVFRDWRKARAFLMLQLWPLPLLT